MDNHFFHFDNSYLSLPDKFYSIVKPQVFPDPNILLLNDGLARELSVSTDDQQDLLQVLLGKPSDDSFITYAQAYAGHQFGHFTRLGDGRAIVLGEHLTPSKARFDIQLKGSGRTPYSRGGDGKATFKAMLREYIISEAMFYLNIPSSRSLAIIKTGEPVYRETVQEGAAVLRVMKSHIRVGTFEYAARFGSAEDIKALTTYTVNRLYPELSKEENLAWSLLRKVMELQIDLVAQWMRVGFIHGVMNTDNTSISGETFDYGPCAFMNTFNPTTVFSSIDQNGRYAFGNQPRIIKWNLARFAEALMPILHEDPKASLQLAQQAIDAFDSLWEQKFYALMLKKIGISSKDPKDYVLLDTLFSEMNRLQLDYTNTFIELGKALLEEENKLSDPGLKPWLTQWKQRVDELSGREQALTVMRKHNPVLIPRNHLVEQALDEAVNGNMATYEKLLTVLSKPYQVQKGMEEYTKPSIESFETSFQTFCGT